MRTKTTSPARQSFLVARRDGNRNWQRVSHSGYVYGGAGACHPKDADMSEAAHKAICNAAEWMFAETIRPQSVDLSVEGVDYRVSPL